jgi:2'-5' RNA ligase
MTRDNPFCRNVANRIVFLGELSAFIKPAELVCMRLFFAVTLPEELIARVADIQQELRKSIQNEGVRWTRPEQFHYTVKFLGEQSEARVHKAIECANSLRDAWQPFELRLGGVGAFPNVKRPSVLWVGAITGGDVLTEIGATLDKMLVNEGFPREFKPVKAHLTLARIKSYGGEASAARALRSAEVGDIGTATIEGFVLMQSDLKSTGSEYAVVESFQFRPA